jgi:hypothetical protein
MIETEKSKETVVDADADEEFGSKCRQNRTTCWWCFWGWVRLSPLGTAATNWPIVPPLMIDDDECGAVGE